MTGARYNNLNLTPTQVAVELLALGRGLADAVDDLDDIEKDVEEKAEAYTMANAKALIQSRQQHDLPNAELQKAWAAMQTSDERLAWNVAKAVVRARKARIDVLKTRVTIGQSVATALRTEMDLDGLRRR